MFLAIVVFLVSALREGRIPRKFPFSTIRQTPESQKLGFDVFAWAAVWPLPRSQTIFWSEGTEKGRCPDAGQRGSGVLSAVRAFLKGNVRIVRWRFFVQTTRHGCGSKPMGPFWLVGEFTAHFRLPILVVGLNRMFTGGYGIGFWPMATCTSAINLEAADGGHMSGAFASWTARQAGAVSSKIQE